MEQGHCFHGLPQRCHVVLPGLPTGGNIAICVRGERGVRLTGLNFGGTEEARAIVRAINASLGIGVAAEQAMMAGCLFGWGVGFEGLVRHGWRVLH